MRLLAGASSPRAGWWLSLRRAVAVTGLTALLGGLVVGVGVTGASAATVDTNAWYVLVNRNSGKALDVYNLADQRRRPDHPVGPQRRRPAAVAVRRLRRRLLPVEIPSLRQGPRRLQLVDRRRRRDRAVGRRQRRQPTVPARGLGRRLRPADQPAQRQGRRGAERLDRRRCQRRAVRRLGRQQPAMAAHPGRLERRQRWHLQQPVSCGRTSPTATSSGSATPTTTRRRPCTTRPVRRSCARTTWSTGSTPATRCPASTSAPAPTTSAVDGPT